jgi:hypothetical protein
MMTEFPKALPVSARGQWYQGWPLIPWLAAKTSKVRIGMGFGAKPLQQPRPPIFFSGLKDPKRSANRIAKYDRAGWIGIQDTPEELTQWRGRSSASSRSSGARTPWTISSSAACTGS